MRLRSTRKTPGAGNSRQKPPEQALVPLIGRPIRRHGIRAHPLAGLETRTLPPRSEQQLQARPRLRRPRRAAHRAQAAAARRGAAEAAVVAAAGRASDALKDLLYSAG